MRILLYVLKMLLYVVIGCTLGSAGIDLMSKTYWIILISVALIDLIVGVRHIFLA